MASPSEDPRKILGLELDATPTREAVMAAFSKLSRRYPPAAFPERFRALLAARDHLLDPAIDLRALLTESEVDISWLRRIPGRQGASALAEPRTDRERGLLWSLVHAELEVNALEAGGAGLGGLSSFDEIAEIFDGLLGDRKPKRRR